MPDRIRTAALDWEDCRYFVALAAEGTLSATARRLRVNHATVARRVASLEAALGRTLFDRRAEGYVLTAEGRAVLEEARGMEEAALGVLRRLDAAGALEGPVRLTTTRSLAEGFLVRRLGGLRRAHPGIDLELLAELRVISLARREADIAIRLGRPADSTLAGRRIGRLGHGFYAAPERAAQVAAGETPVLVGYDQDSAFVPETTWLATHFPSARLAFRSNSQAAQAQAARVGFGVALLPHYLAAGDPLLVAVDLGATPPSREAWLLVRRDISRVPRVRAVAEAVATIFRQDRMVLEGTRAEEETAASAPSAAKRR
ncbi:LysR family transcriptional regulator [Roseomonas rosulenta]|uniref:LysR family transcriptional regulator n=1 Tax=Roseomonas rosulenta TaxID=2748667 RepID=UPI0018DF57DC|nr:LysR family transcriptional regulator [Roseomonas rosulenta]